MSDHHIEGLVGVSLGQIKDMLGINTIVGDPIMTPSGDTILPISRVGVGFVAGGSDIYTDHHEHEHAAITSASPFGGGTGGGVSITPIAFLVVGASGVKVVPLDNQTHLLDKVIDSAPSIIDKFQSMMKGSMQGSAQGSTQTGTQGTAQQDFSVGNTDYSV